MSASIGDLRAAVESALVLEKLGLLTLDGVPARLSVPGRGVARVVDTMGRAGVFGVTAFCAAMRQGGKFKTRERMIHDRELAQEGRAL